MAVHVAFNEIEALDTPTSSSTRGTSSSSVSLSGINREGIAIMDANRETITLPSGLDEGWVRFRNRIRHYSGGLVDATAFAAQRSSDETPLFEFKHTSSSRYDVFVRTGLDQEDVLVSFGDDTADFDVNFKIAEQGYVRFYKNEVLVHSVSGDTRFGGGVQEINQLLLGATTNSGSTAGRSTYFSHIIVSDNPTIGARVYTLPLSAGAVNEWTGSVDNISGADPSLVSNALSTEDVDKTVLFSATMSAFNNDNDQYISALVLSTQSHSELGDITDKFEFVYDGSPTGDVSESVGEIPQRANIILNHKPGTTENWSIADISNAEFGIISRAS